MERKKSQSLERLIAKHKAKKSKAQLNRERIAKKRRDQMERRQRAVELYQNGASQTRVAEELQTSPGVINNWLKQAGVLIPRKKAVDEPKEDEFKPFSFEDMLEETMQDTTEKTLVQARTEEEKSILELANNQANPADQYQAWLAANAIRMLRDNMANIRGPRTVKELSELDQLVRRSLGLNPKGNGGSSAVTIDISILNNTKADLSAKGLKKTITIDADTLSDDSDDSYQESQEINVQGFGEGLDDYE